MTRHSMDYSCTSPPVRYTVGTAVGDRNTAELSGRDTASIVRRDSSLCEYGLHSTAPRRPGCHAGKVGLCGLRCKPDSKCSST
jgi:hypothetical protein